MCAKKKKKERKKHILQKQVLNGLADEATQRQEAAVHTMQR